MTKNKMLFNFYWKVMIGSMAYSLSLFADIPQSQDPQVVVYQDLICLNDVIAATEKNLEAQRHLKGLIEEYQLLQAAYYQNPENPDILIKMVKQAYLITEQIKQAHLNHVFSADFLSELNLFAQFAQKKGLPQP